MFLQPMQLALYKGTLFPSAYYVRRTSLGSGLNRSIPNDFAVFGEQLPYAVVRESSVDIHNTGGSKKLFELWEQDNANKGPLATLYRAASKAEYQLQILIQNYKRTNLDKPVTAKDLTALRKILATMNNDIHSSEIHQLNWIIKESASWTRHELVSKLIESIGYRSGGVFTSFNYHAADGFKGPDDVIITYQISISKLKELILANEAYLGIEYDYFEFAFIDQPGNQKAKALLFNSIVKANGPY